MFVDWLNTGGLTGTRLGVYIQPLVAHCIVYGQEFFEMLWFDFPCFPWLLRGLFRWFILFSGLLKGNAFVEGDLHNGWGDFAIFRSMTCILTL